MKAESAYPGVAVIGSGGFLGGAIADAVSGRPLRLLALDVHEGASTVSCDVDDYDRLAALLADFCPRVVINAAALTYTDRVLTGATASRMARVNSLGAVNAFAAAAESGASTFVQISSASVYDDSVAGTQAISEQHPTAPASWYSRTKLVAEQMCEQYRSFRGGSPSLRILRVSSPYGPGESASTTRPNTSAIGVWVKAALSGETAFAPRDFSRDFAYVVNVANAVVRASLSPTARHTLYNIGSGVEYSVPTVMEAIQRHIPAFRYELGTSADAQPQVFRSRPMLDVTRFSNEFGAEPGTDLDVGVGAYIRWLNPRIPGARECGP